MPKLRIQGQMDSDTAVAKRRELAIAKPREG